MTLRREGWHAGPQQEPSGRAYSWDVTARDSEKTFKFSEIQNDSLK